MKSLLTVVSIFLVSCGVSPHAANRASLLKWEGDSACGSATASELINKYQLTSSSKTQGKFTLTIKDQDGNVEQVDEGTVRMRQAAKEDEVDVTMEGAYSGVAGKGYNMATWAYTEQGVAASGDVNYKMEQTNWLLKLNEPSWLRDVNPLFTFQVQKIAATSCGLTATSEPAEINRKSYTLTVDAQF